MTRRAFLSMAPPALAAVTSPAPVVVPLRVVIDAAARLSAFALNRFWWKLWPEVVREFAYAGIRLDMQTATGGIWRSMREPGVGGLERGVLNLVVTDRIPLAWDRGRALSGVTTLYRGFHLCMVGLDHAHANQIPLLSTNTCVHELLHALLLDIFESHPPGIAVQTREFRVDWCATSLWMFHGCAGLRESARRYVERLRAG